MSNAIIERTPRTADEIKELSQGITELDAAIQKSRQRDGRNPVVVADKTYSAVEARNLIETMRQELAVELNDVRRRADEASGKEYESYVDAAGNLRYRRKDAPNPLLLNPEKAVELFGQRAFSQLSAQQKADAYSLRASDLDGIDLRLYFGPGSSGAKAQALAASNPAKYRILRARAIEQGIL